MKRVIVAAVLLWFILILISYRMTAQDSVLTYIVSVKSTLTQLSIQKKMGYLENDTMMKREAMLYQGVYYLKSSAWFEYLSCGAVCFAVYTPAPLNLSATRKRNAFVLRPF